MSELVLTDSYRSNLSDIKKSEVTVCYLIQLTICDMDINNNSNDTYSCVA